MNDKHYWERIILDAAPPALNLGSLAVGDVDGDGHQEIVTGGVGALLWYWPATGGSRSCTGRTGTRRRREDYTQAPGRAWSMRARFARCAALRWWT